MAKLHCEDWVTTAAVPLAARFMVLSEGKNVLICAQRMRGGRRKALLRNLPIGLSSERWSGSHAIVPTDVNVGQKAERVSVTNVWC